MNNFNFSFNRLDSMTVITNPPGVSTATYPPPQDDEAPENVAASSGAASSTYHGATYSSPMPAVPMTFSGLYSDVPTMMYPSNGLTAPVGISALPSAPNQEQLHLHPAPAPLQHSAIQTPEQKLIPLSRRGVQCIRSYAKFEVEITVPGAQVRYPWAKARDWINWQLGKADRDYARKMKQPPAGYTPAQVEAWAGNVERRLRLDQLALGGMLFDLYELQHGVRMEVICLSEREDRFWMEFAQASGPRRL